MTAETENYPAASFEVAMGSIPDALAKIALLLSSAPRIVNVKLAGTAIQRHHEKEKLKMFVAKVIERWKRFI